MANYTYSKMVSCLLLAITFVKPAVVLEGKVTKGYGSDKYAYYQVKPTQVISNRIKFKFLASIKLARFGTLSQPEIGKSYIFDLDYYNPDQKSYGLKIVDFKSTRVHAKGH
ncbi:MAG: hypothetical protein ABL962_03795 [Fimbriimonadaceae bacterium]